MKLLLPLILLFTLFGCKETATQSETTTTQTIQPSFPIDPAKLAPQIRSFHIQKYSDKPVDYRLGEINILQVIPVTNSYVDSLKSELYQNGIATLTDNLNVRSNYLENLRKRIRRYESEGRFEKAGEVRKSMESYEQRNEVQETERLILAERDSIVRLRLEEPDTTTGNFFQVEYALLEQLDLHARQDTQSLIFRKDHRIEDLLEDKAWEAE